MRVFAICICVGLSVAALCGAALAWDGSAYLFHILDTHTLYMPHYRYATAPLQAIVLLVAAFTNSVQVLQVVFGLVYACVPVLALAAAWLVVRRDARQLFVWAALGITLGTLPGQFFFVSEAVIAVQLFWPLWLAVLVGAPPRHLALMLALVLGLALSHPFAIPLLGLAALLALAIGWRNTGIRRRLWGWALGLGAAAAVSAGIFVLLADSYQAEQLSPDVVRYAFMSLAGLPLAALLLAGLGAVLLVATSGVITGQRSATMGNLVSLVLFGSAGVLFALWARDPALWKRALDFRYLVPLSALPLLALAAWDGLGRSHEQLGRLDNIWQQRLRATQVAGGIFALVLTLQGASWFATTDRLRTTLASSRWTCISATSEPWLATTPLDHWSVTPYALLLQGQAPTHLVMAGDGCGSISPAAQLQLNSWTQRDWQSGWFDLTDLRGKLATEQETPQGCTFQLTSGWHQTERSGPYWWRWSDGRSPMIRILAEKDLDAALYGQIETIKSPNSVDVQVNGVSQAKLDLAQTGLQMLQPVSVSLKRGINTVQFTSQNRPVETQGRPLALSLANLVLASGDKTLACSLHP